MIILAKQTYIKYTMIPKNEYAPYFGLYIKPIEEKGFDILEALEDTQKNFDSVLAGLPLEKQNYAYAEAKWTVKQVIQHIIDTERVFCYRALAIARNGSTELPGFDQDVFAAFDNSSERDYDDLLEEMRIVRQGSILLFKSFTKEAIERIGVASRNKISVRAIGLVLSGHQNHHLKIIEERYL